MRKIDVVAAIIVDNGNIFCTQRPNKGEVALKWEFPGGKIELGESHSEALKREIKEELNCDIRVNKYYMSIKHQYNNFHLTMHCYKCTLISGDIQLHEHVDYCWLPKDKLHILDWAPADIPIVNALCDMVGKNEL
jgi:8-oxo-dGTP diphosphatase